MGIVCPESAAALARPALDGRGGVVSASRRLALVVRTTAPDVPSIALEFLFSFMFVPQAVLPLLALLYASGMIQDEQEDQTLTYLLIRPISKWALYIVKLLATLTTTMAMTCVFTVLMYAAIYLGPPSRAI